MGPLAVASVEPPRTDPTRQRQPAPASAFIQPPPPEPPVPTPQPDADSFLGMPTSALLARLSQPEIASVRMNRGGSSVSLRIEFSDGSHAAFKPEQTNSQSVPRKEVAAYRLGRLLGLQALAPAIMRAFPRQLLVDKLDVKSRWAQKRIEAETLIDENGQVRGALAYWIPRLADLHVDTSPAILAWTQWLSQAGRLPSDKHPLLAQLSTLLLFDLLQNNSDRFSGGNVLGSLDRQSLYIMDNAFGFQSDPQGHQRCWGYLRRSQRFSRRFVAALEHLHRDELRTAMQDPGGPPLLTRDEIDALLARRDAALAYIQSLSSQHGAAKVLAFE